MTTLYTLCLNDVPTLVMSDDTFNPEDADVVDAAVFMEHKPWLRDELQAFGLSGHMTLRAANDPERGLWAGALQQAQKDGEIEPGDTGWLAYLVPVSEQD